LVLIGWRGEPGKKDEPQHSKQGKITLQLLQTLGIDYTVLSAEAETAMRGLENAVHIMNQYQRPYALVVREGTFLSYKLKEQNSILYQMSREDAIKTFACWNSIKDVIISTTGKTSRELFEYRMSTNNLHQDFLTVGSMGHASQIAVGIALTQPDRQVFCLDGDGALLMHMGSLAIVGNLDLPNFKHVIINNGAHDSVGGQPTVGFNIDIPAIARACGYAYASRVETSEDLIEELNILRVSQGPALLEVRVNKGARPHLGRPTMTPIENRESFLQFLRE
jgi:phosphonopyruvate decarboxylase